MTDVQEYWRDKINQILGWGVGIVLLVAGWSVTQPGEFELSPLWRETHPFAKDIDRDNIVRAAGLIAFALAFVTFYPRLLQTIYERWLLGGTDETVIPLAIVRFYARIVGALLLMLAILVSVF